MTIRNSKQDADDLFNACHNCTDYNTVQTKLSDGVDPNHEHYYSAINNGHTPLHRSCYYNNDRSVRLLIKWGANVEAIYKVNGHTPLHDACSNGSIGAVKVLLEFHSNTDAKNNNGESPLDVAVRCGYTEIVNLLKAHIHHQPKDPLSTYPSVVRLNGMSVDDMWVDLGLELGLSREKLSDIERNTQNPQNRKAAMFLGMKKSNVDNFTFQVLVKALLRVGNSEIADEICTGEGHTPATVAAHYGWLDLLKFLAEMKGYDLKGIVNKSGQTPLFLAYANRHKEVVQYLVEVHHCDPRFLVNETGDTPFHLECIKGDLEMIKCLDDKKGNLDDCLLISCKHNHGHIVNYLLDDRHCDPNTKNDGGQTPLALTTDNKIIRSLLKHGAQAADVYKTYRKIIGEIFPQHAPQNPVTMLIIGNGGTGKSTFLAAFMTKLSMLQRLGVTKGVPVTGVDHKTVGIIPYLYETKKLGKVLIYDFAGQLEFYASHSAVLQNVVHSCPPIIVFCCNLLDSEAYITKTTTYWMSFIHNQCSALKDQAHVVVLGSHADILLGRGGNPRSNERNFTAIIEKFPKFKFIAFVPMDCRLPNSIEMKEVRQHLDKSSPVLRSPEAISLNAHALHIYIQDNFTNELAVPLNVVREKFEIDLKQAQSQSEKDLLSFIPNTLTCVIEVCSQLSKKGHMMFLLNESTPENSYIVCDQQTLLSEVTGTIYAPSNFRQHCRLHSSTGVVPLLKLHIQFKQYDIDMLVAFMSHLEFCFEIKDEQVFKYISTHQLENPYGASTPNLDNRYLFFPGLITIAYPVGVWEPEAYFKFHFGWILYCSQQEEFFDARCLHVLILRLVFTFMLAPTIEIDLDIPSLQGFCSIWKNGICWCNDNGITCLVELVEHSKALVVQIRCQELTPECLEFRSLVVCKVLETSQQICPNLNTIESVILPAEVETHPLNTISQLSLFEIHDMALAIHTMENVNSMYVSASVPSLLQFEPFACLDRESLSFLYHPQNSSLEEKVSNSFIAHLHNQVSNDERMLGKILSNIDRASSSQGLSHTLEMWRTETEGTYQCLKDTLDKCSIFGGRNPLDLAGVPSGNWDPSLFAAIAAIEGPELIPEQMQPVNCTAHPGDKVDLMVPVVLQALSTFQWFIDDQPISTNDAYYEGSQTSTLIVKECLSKHKGIYKCMVMRQANSTTYSHYTKLELNGTRIDHDEQQLLGQILQTFKHTQLAEIGISVESLVSGKSDQLLEELQFLLRKIPSCHQFADNLTEENLKTRVKEEQLFQEAMKDDIKLSLIYLKMIALGPPQVGKSTFIRRLLGMMKWDIDTAPSETQPPCSTGLVEMMKVYVNEDRGSPRREGAPLKGYTCQTAMVSPATWLTFEGDLKLEEELATLNKMIKDASATRLTKVHSQSPAYVKEQKHSKHAEVVEKSNSTFVQVSDMPSHKGVSVKSDYTSNHEDTVVEASEFSREECEKVRGELDKSISDFENLRLKAITDPSFSSKLFRIIINTGDVGGQPAFLEMIPALTIGPAMYIVLMKLLQGLKTTYPVTFKCEGDEEARSCLGYTYTSEEVIFQALSSIACFGLPDEDLQHFIGKDGESKKQESVTLLCGTFADQVIDEADKIRVNEMEKLLKGQLEGSSFFKEGLVEYAERDDDPDKCRVLFQINNKAGGEEEVMRYRKILENLIENKFRKFEIPARWFMVSLFLKSVAKKGDKSTVSIEECLKIGQKLKMEDNMVRMALRFLHKYIGLVMYFPEIDDSYLKQHVICDPQVVFSSITELIFKVYDPNNRNITLAKQHHFIQTGQFSPRDIKVEGKDGLLPVNSLVKLLVHLNIAAPIPCTRDDPYYILPAVLQTARDEVLQIQNEEALESLLVQFKTGFLPLGVFCALIANLVAANDRNLKLMHGIKSGYTVHRNKVTFRALGKYDVTLISWPKYIEIRVCSVRGDTSAEYLSTCCPYIRQTVCKALDRVIIGMKKNSLFKPSTDYSLGFRCTNHSTNHAGHEPLMLIDSKDYSPISDTTPVEMTCSTCFMSTELSTRMKVWYREPVPPNISSEPASVLEVGEGKDTTLRVTAQGSSPLTYQWTRDGKNLQDNIHYDGSSTDCLQMKQAHINLRGKYCCIVSNRVGSVSSTPTDLTIGDLNFSYTFTCDELYLWLSQNKMPRTDLEILKDQNIDGETFCNLLSNKDTLKELRSLLTIGGRTRLSKLIEEPHKASGIEEVHQPVSASDRTKTLPTKMTIGSLRDHFNLSDEQLDGCIERSELSNVSCLFDNWRCYTGYLGLDDGQQQTIFSDPNLTSNAMKVEEALKLWWDFNPIRATFRNLLNIVVELKKGNVAMKICAHLAKTNIATQPLSTLH